MSNDLVLFSIINAHSGSKDAFEMSALFTAVQLLFGSKNEKKHMYIIVKSLVYHTEQP